MKILAIETSCDDTCAAVLENDTVLSSVISSQTDLHAKWGGVVPDIAKRAHEERIMVVIAEALKKVKSLSSYKVYKVEDIIQDRMREIDVIAVTVGPGLAIALGIGVKTAKELAKKYNKKLIAVNHIEGHILSNLAKNKNGKPIRKVEYPALVLTVSGGHTKLILMNQDEKFPISNFPTSLDFAELNQFPKKTKTEKQNPPGPTSSRPPSLKKGGSLNIKYTVVGETLDDAAGEALDKAAKMLGLGYPGGPIIERLAEKGDPQWIELPRPLSKQKNFDFSFSGLKTSFYYKIKDWSKEKIGKNLANLAASYQEAVFDSLLIKYKKAIENYCPKTLMVSGGVAANLTFRKELRKLAKAFNLPIYMPFKKEWNTDNAVMIGVAGYYKALRGEFVENVDELDRDPRAKI